jgi:outer membrane protein assembly factor BamB
MVYVGSLDGNLYAIDEMTGERTWTRPLIDPDDPDDPGAPVRFSSPAVAYGKVYIGTWYGYDRPFDSGLYCVDAQSGEILWYSEVGKVDSSPVVVDSTVYVTGGGMGGEWLYALEAETGDTKWQLQLLEEGEHSTDPLAYNTLVSSPAISGGHLYIGLAASWGNVVMKIK